MSRIIRLGAIAFCFLLTVVPIFAGKPPVFPNAVKYREAGAKPSTGRSGSAAIQARALRGQTETTIEVTTGDFDGTVQPAGRLDKVQVKLFSPKGDVLVTDNYRKATLSGATGTFTYDWPTRGQALQVQANVSGIDPDRTDVVTVSGTVSNRPDLTVSAINAPGQAVMGAKAVIGAVVREINGDTGARADCVLKIDGTVADRADGIWVDAGDSVSCEFSHTFNATGTRQISVEVTGVNPGDWDTTNNSKTASIEIVDSRVLVSVWYDLYAFDTEDDWVSETEKHEQFQQTDSTTLLWTVDSHDTGHTRQHTVIYQADLGAKAALKFPITMQSTLRIDGLQVGETPSLSVMPDTFETTEWYTSACAQLYTDGSWYQLCGNHYTFPGREPWDETWVSTSRQTGRIIYESRTLSLTRFPETGQEYVYEHNYTGEDLMGDPVNPLPPSLGNNVAMTVSMTDADNRHFEISGSVQLFDFPTTTTYYDYGCTSYSYLYSTGVYSGQSCSHATGTSSGKAGMTSGTDLQ